MCIILIGIFFTQKPFAGVFESVFGTDTDLIMIEDAETDLAARVNIIRNAKYSVEILSHSHTNGLVGSAISLALRDALNNNVKVKYLYEKVWSVLGGDIHGANAQLITDVNLKRQAEVIEVPVIKKLLKTPFSFFHFFHGKIIIVDRGTKDEVILAGGRNHDESGFTWLDLSYVIRRVPGANKNGKSISDQLSEYFDTTWSLAEKYYEKKKVSKLSKKNTELVNQYSYPKLSFDKAVIDTINSPVEVEEKDLKEFQFRPDFFRLVTNDALSRVEQRKDKDDDITSYLSSFFENAESIKLSTYILMMPKVMINALKSVVVNGGGVDIYTNNRNSIKRILPLAIAGEIAEGYNAETTAKLVENSADDSKVRVSMFDADKAAREGKEINYQHRKLALIKTRSNSGNEKYFSWLGSYNFTQGSADYNDEFGIMVRDSRLYRYLDSINKRESKLYHVQVSPEEARQIIQKGKILRNLCRKSYGLMF